jgi:hypothetical protein
MKPQGVIRYLTLYKIKYFIALIKYMKAHKNITQLNFVHLKKKKKKKKINTHIFLIMIEKIRRHNFLQSSMACLFNITH